MNNGRKYYWCAQCKRWTTTHDTKDQTGKQIQNDKKLTTSTLPSEIIVINANTVVADTFSLVFNSVNPKSVSTSVSTNLTTYDLSTLRNHRSAIFKTQFQGFQK